MHFQLHQPPIGGGPSEQFDWTLVRADESIVCRSSTCWPSERELRSQLAKDKKSMAGCSRYKVKSPE